MVQLKALFKEKCKWYYLGFPCLLVASFVVAMLSTDRSTPIHAFFILMYYFIMTFVVISTIYIIIEILHRPNEGTMKTIIKNLFKKIACSIAWVVFASLIIYLSLIIWRYLSSNVNVSGIFEMLDYMHASTTSLLLIAFMFLFIVQAVFIAALCIEISKAMKSKFLRYMILAVYLLIVLLIVMIQINSLPLIIAEQTQNSLIGIIDVINDTLLNTLPYFATYIASVCFIAFIVTVIIAMKRTNKSHK